MKGKRKFRKILLISCLLAFIGVLASTAYAQEILWIEYDDFEAVSTSNNLWQLGVINMCSGPNPNPYFANGKMLQEAKAQWYDPTCSPNSALFFRVRSRAAISLAAPYITGIGARVTLDQCTNYTHLSPPPSPPISNTVRNRLGAVFYNDGVLTNRGDGTDLTSEVFTGIDIRSSEVRWYVARLLDPNGVTSSTIAWGQLYLPLRPDLTNMPFDLKVWFDGTTVYFSAETESATGEQITTESTYTPGGQILPPKSPPVRILESMIDMPYLPLTNFKPDSNDGSYIKTEWDDVWVAVEATNLGAVEQIIHKASAKP